MLAPISVVLPSAVIQKGIERKRIDARAGEGEKEDARLRVLRVEGNYAMTYAPLKVKWQVLHKY